MSKPKPKHYVVWRGRKAGVFSTWAETEAQVKGFTGAEFKAFESLAEAQKAFAGRYADYKGKAASQGRLLGVPPAVTPSWTVDAACSGNPGLLEYRCVDTATGEEIFHQGPFPQGTNNVGEFLAIVEALIRAKRDGVTWPIYSDSVNALGWVAAKKARTNLTQTEANAELFERMTKAEAWLRANPFPNRLLKWQTDSWGENPADFGRK